ncbi:hypothetical protein M9Y10_039561 [Tritrichomonas musculus]|uniref:Uncharacterized protein n=1 Tax=Tritrichomonas musculus TaxID=1915356 RepID=A0ABR2KDH3_9EUKA
MRKITFLWFFHLCWNDDKKWTLLTTIFIPLVPIAIICEIHRFLNSRTISHLSLVMCLALTAWINEIILKPALAIPPLDDSCFAGCYAPSTFVALGFAALTVYLLRFAFSGPREILGAICWGVFAILEFVAHPFSNYLSWTNDAISIVPGVVIGVFWASLVEFKFFSVFLYELCQKFKIENDINREGYQREDLIAS